MVKNTTGGSRHKSQARKNVTSGRSTGVLRLVEEAGECYAQVEKLLGGSNCHVACMDGITRLCHIRGKFRGRSKRDNRIESGTWIMVGVRDYESTREGSGKLQNCDLLEVYRDTDKERLKKSVREDWSKFITRDNERDNLGKTSSEDFAFVTEEEEEMENYIIQSTNLSSRDGDLKDNDGEKISVKTDSTIFAIGENDGSDIDIDDI